MEGWEELKPEGGLGFRWDFMRSKVLARAKSKICFFFLLNFLYVCGYFACMP